MENHSRRIVGFEQSVVNILGKEFVFGKRFLKLEHKIFKLTGSKVKFSSLNLDLPSKNELETAKKNKESLIFIPDTMTVTEQRGVKLDQPSTVPITLEGLFELFYSRTEAKTIMRLWNTAHRETAKTSPNSRRNPKVILERKTQYEKVEIKFNELINKFRGGILDLGGLIEIIGTDYDSQISGGWHVINNHDNNELIEPEAFASKMSARLPSLMELFMIQLVSSANDNVVDGQAWLPTNSTAGAEVTVGEPNLDPGRVMFYHILDSKVKGRRYVTYSKKRGVGTGSLRDDIPQYRKNIMTIR